MGQVARLRRLRFDQFGLAGVRAVAPHAGLLAMQQRQGARAALSAAVSIAMWPFNPNDVITTLAAPGCGAGGLSSPALQGAVLAPASAPARSGEPHCRRRWRPLALSARSAPTARPATSPGTADGPGDARSATGPHCAAPAATATAAADAAAWTAARLERLAGLGATGALALRIHQAFRRRIRPKPVSATPAKARETGSGTVAMGVVSNITSDIAAAAPP